MTAIWHCTAISRRFLCEWGSYPARARPFWAYLLDRETRMPNSTLLAYLSRSLRFHYYYQTRTPFWKILSLLTSHSDRSTNEISVVVFFGSRILPRSYCTYICFVTQTVGSILQFWNSGSPYPNWIPVFSGLVILDWLIGSASKYESKSMRWTL